MNVHFRDISAQVLYEVPQVLQKQVDNYTMWQLLGYRVGKQRLGNMFSPSAFGIQLLCEGAFTCLPSAYYDCKLFGVGTISY